MTLDPVFKVFAMGDATYMSRVLNGVASIGGQGYGQIALIGFVIGLVVMGFRSVMSGGKEIGLAYLFISVVAFQFMFVPRVTVAIEPLTTPPGVPDAPVLVDNVPLGAAVAGTMISHVGYAITSLFSRNFNSATSEDTVMNGGFGNTLNILTTFRMMMDVAPIGASSNYAAYRSTLAHYLRDCVLPESNTGTRNLDVILHDPMFIDAIKVTNSWRTTYEELSIPGEFKQVSCNDAYNVIVNKGTVRDVFGDQLLALRASTRNPDPMAAMEGAFVSMNAQGAFHAQNQMLASTAIAVMGQALVGNSISPADVTNISMMSQAEQQRATQWAGQGTMFISVARPMMGFFEGLMYAMLPFLCLMIGTGSYGLSMIVKYALLGIMVSLWLPLLALVDLFQNVKVEHAVAALQATANAAGDAAGGALNSLAGTSELYSVTTNALATGGMLASMVPVLSMVVIFGGAYAFTAMAGRVTGADHIREQQTSPDVFQAAAAQSVAAQFSSSPGAGTMMTGAQPRLPSFGVGQLHSQTERAEASYRASTMTDFGERLHEAVQNGATLTSQGAHDLSSKMDTMGSGEMSDALRQGKGYDSLHQLAQSMGISDAAVFRTAASLSFGTNKLGVGPGVDAGQSSQHNLSGEQREAFNNAVKGYLDSNSGFGAKLLVSAGGGEGDRVSDMFGSSVSTDQAQQLDQGFKKAYNADKTYSEGQSTQSTIKADTSVNLADLSQSVTQHPGASRAMSEYFAEHPEDRAQMQASAEHLASMDEFRGASRAQIGAAAGVMTLYGDGQVDANDPASIERAQAFLSVYEQSTMVAGSSGVIGDPDASLRPSVEAHTGQVEARNVEGRAASAGHQADAGTPGAASIRDRVDAGQESTRTRAELATAGAINAFSNAQDNVATQHAGMMDAQRYEQLSTAYNAMVASRSHSEGTGYELMNSGGRGANMLSPTGLWALNSASDMSPEIQHQAQSLFPGDDAHAEAARTAWGFGQMSADVPSGVARVTSGMGADLDHARQVLGSDTFDGLVSAGRDPGQSQFGANAVTYTQLQLQGGWVDVNK
jgi:hypothetical protein